MIEWKEELQNLDEDKLKHIEKFLKRYEVKLSKNGRIFFMKLIRKNEFKILYDALEISMENYFDSEEENSFNLVCDKINSIIRIFRICFKKTWKSSRCYLYSKRIKFFTRI